MSIIVAFLVFLTLVTIHEFGHFIMAKWAGIKVNEFAVGMGPAILKKQKGETLYSLRIFPLGGYCAMEGEDEDSADERSFDNAKAYKRLVVILAGAFMNMLLAVVAFLIVNMQSGFTDLSIDKIEANSPAYIAGIQENDEIISYNGKKPLLFLELRNMIINSKNESDTLTLKRDGKLINVEIKPELATIEDNGKTIEYKKIGIMPKVRYDFIGAFKESINTCRYAFRSMFDFLGRAFKGNVKKNEVSGPVVIIKTIASAAKVGFSSVMFLLGLISINLAFFNLLPFPALDGGKAVFILFEMITGIKPNKKVEYIVNIVGFSLLILLFLFVTYNDIKGLIR
ncbi:M50 family metallopeptidase [Fenollaria massiliensis]|uniref:M50 family metallopeptidase n=1 Tax=Fenollaria massiliensis TaxID=938288 RepID=A0A9E7IXF0_9FIRM|nr:M50 family metallopeptidase [Fenollaria massiliensis]UQK59845.1 M50 family metallopeptidase [Fenollaria massiliensis]